MIQSGTFPSCIRYTTTEPTDKNWGVQLPNGTWAGLTGMLVRKVGVVYTLKTDMGLSHVLQTC